MEDFEDERDKSVPDAPLDWKPMQLMKKTLSSEPRLKCGANDDSSKGILYSLKAMDVALGHTIKNRASVIEPGAHECTSDRLSHVVSDSGTDMTESSDMVVCRLADGANVLIHLQVVVKSYTKNFDMIS
jgi:hypothetical protein